MASNFQFAGFTFKNPEEFKTENSKNINEVQLINGKSKTEAGATLPQSATVKGYFFGSNAVSSVNTLKALQKSGAPAWLYLPNGTAIFAHLKTVTATFSATRNAYYYELTFIEAVGNKNARRKLLTTTAEEGENMFHIAKRTGVQIEKLMKINNLKTPFDVSAGDEVRLS